MKKIEKQGWALLLVIFVCVSCNDSKKTKVTSEPKQEQQSVKTISPINLAKNGLGYIFKTYSATDVEKYFMEDYIQHNPNVPTGRSPIVDLLPVLKESGTTYTNHRIFQDDNFVVMHNSYHNAQPFGVPELVAFDIFRVEDGKIAEHWDAVTPLVEQTASGRSQTDGQTEVTDLEKTDENKALVKKLVEEVFIAGESANITNYISTEQYDQHNPMVGDGLEGLTKAIEYLSSQNNMFKYFKIHKLLGQGNFVLAQVEGEWNGKPHLFYDLFRVENGKVVEHWDVVNEIPEKMAHSNGVF